MWNYNKLKDYVLKRGTKKNIQDLISIFIIGLVIVIAANFFMPSKKVSPGYIEVSEQKEAVSPVNMGYEEKVKSELTSVLTQIEGVGKVEVMMYFETGDEVVPAYSQNGSTKVTEETDGNGGKRITNENSNSTAIVTSNEGGGSRPFVIKEVKPKVSGIIVVAEGASNPDVKYKLYQAVKTVFNIEQYKVNIYPMEKNK